MVAASCTEVEFIRLFEANGAAGTAHILGVNVRNVYDRRRRIEETQSIQLRSPDPRSPDRLTEQHPARIRLDVDTGTVIVFSDAHYWPGRVSTAHKALIKMIGELQPKLIIANGDVVDGAKISRHPPMGWEELPSVSEELETCRERLAEIKAAAPKKCRFTWTLGNHDQRFEARLAQAAPEYAQVEGIHLKDHFGMEWVPCWATWLNDDVVVKHRFKGGIHATHNGTMWAGKTMVTGHLHSLKVTPFTDYNGTRYGVDTGTLAEPDGPQFEYGEDNPKNHRSGFAVLTFHKGRLLWPQLVHVTGPNEFEFERKIYTV
tara:strand:+ start:85 stop:1035 length:951 start_codon:yes stop_codon:yes gene_type:complete